MADHDKKKAPLECDDGAPQAVFTQPLMITQHSNASQLDDLAPHSFMGLAIIVHDLCLWIICVSHSRFFFHPCSCSCCRSKFSCDLVNYIKMNT